MTTPTCFAGQVMRRHGAWLVNVPDHSGSRSTEDEWDCSASLADAKRIAREMAEDIGFEGRVRWEENDPGIRNLYYARSEQ